MPKGDAKEGYLNTNAHLEAKVAMLERALAESQAREAQLREACEKAADWLSPTYVESCEARSLCYKALDAQQDDSALREMIAADREACAAFVESDCADNQMADPRELKQVAAAIRARKG